MTLIDVLTVMGVAVVLPWAIPEVTRAVWTGCAGLTAAALLLPEGIGAAAVAAALPLVAAVAAIRAARSWWATPSRALIPAVPVAVGGFAIVAGAALVQSRLGRSAFGIHEPIVQLTAVHFTFAGAGATALAAAALRHGASRRRRLAITALVLTVLAPPVVAMGFVTDAAVPQVSGAVLMTLGVWSTATVQLAGLRARSRRVQALLLASSVAVFVAMPLAVTWAAAQHLGRVPALSIRDMVRTHGMLNGVVFVPCGLLAWRIAARQAHRREREGPACRV